MAQSHVLEHVAGRVGFDYLTVDSNTGRLTIEGVTVAKSDNREEAVPVHASNVVITRLDESDKLRMQKLTENRS